jgi:hypothetical protein
MKVAAVVVAFAALVAVPAALAAKSIADPAGDGGGAPDIRALQADVDSGGGITVRLVFGKAPSKAALYATWQDADRRATTGATACPGPIVRSKACAGAEWAMTYQPAKKAAAIWRWDKGKWVDWSRYLSADIRDKEVVFFVDRLELGAPKTLALGALSAVAQGNRGDRAPNTGLMTMPGR